jgi:hypothetical protein
LADHANETDPLNAPIVGPPIPSPTREKLDPFLDGWRFYGPESSYRYVYRL